MSLVAVYDALKAADVPDDKARDAVREIEQQTVRDKDEWRELRQWRSATDQRLVRLEVMGAVILAVNLAVLGRLFFM